MKRSTERILTTFVGSLARPPELIEMLKAKESGQGLRTSLSLRKPPREFPLLLPRKLGDP